MEFRCETSTVTVETLSQMYMEGTLIKPRIQRPKRWVNKDSDGLGKTNSMDFIKFIIKTGNTVNPLLLVEKIVNGKKSLLVIDGNNRVNAILLFIQSPLYFYSEYIPSSFSPCMKELLEKQPLVEILKCRNFKTYCKLHNMMDEYKDSLELDLDTEFDDMCDKLHSMRFLDIKVPITRFENISSDNIKEIYEGVNKGGVKLTKQEILASTTSTYKYLPHQLTRYNELLIKVQMYYDDMTEKEMLKVQDREDEGMNMFEVLLGFQMLLSEQYKFMQQPGLKELDIVFKCYEMIYGTFETYNENIDGFLRVFQILCDYLAKIHSCFYNKHISYASIEKCNLNIKGNSLCILLILLYKNKDEIDTKEFTSHVRKILLYNELCTMIGEKKSRSKYAVKNMLQFQAGGHYISTTAKNILKNNINMSDIPTLPEILEVLDIVNQENVNACRDHDKNPRRLKVVKFKLLVLSLYYNQKVPFDMLSTSKDIDHIIPFSVQNWAEELDINRLGNLILIDSAVNKKKGNKHITDDFITNNHLQYMNFPANAEVSSILGSDMVSILDTYKYNCMCEKRETQYFHTIIQAL